MARHRSSHKIATFPPTDLRRALRSLRGCSTDNKPAGEGMNDRQVAGAGGLGPVLMPALMSGIWLEQGGERTDQRGEAGHLGACGGELASNACWLELKAAGCEQEPGDALG
jgi:hypothetical protein